jgi:hypothetical protein
LAECTLFRFPFDTLNEHRSHSEANQRHYIGNYKIIYLRVTMLS